MCGVIMSDYLVALETANPDVAARYRQKISMINGVDPFLLQDSQFSYDPKAFPNVDNMDIVSYLVLTTSYYSKTQMKAYKSLTAYKYFEAGFVTNCGVCHVNNYVVIIANVRHSQKMNEPPLRAWVICTSMTDASVESAHCTCMAGAGEVCSHIGALLYALEYITTAKTNTSCTDVRSLWNIRKTNIECKPIKEIGYGRVIAYGKQHKNVPPVVGDELQQLLGNIEESRGSSVLFRIVEPFASSLESDVIILNPYTTLYNETYENLNYEQLLQLSEEFMNVDISDEECTQIKVATEDQANSQAWFHQRTGRITASNLKRVCRTPLVKPSLTIIKQICYPLKFKFRNKAIDWGVKHEKVALEAYTREQDSCHYNLVVERVGFCITRNLPQFGASPDAFVNCDCCGHGCIEIKCPYTLQNMTIDDFTTKKTSCLIKEGTNSIQLDKTHAYYYQIQQQMAITRTSYCDFVVWSPSELFVERVPFNEDFWFDVCQIATDFHRKVIVPELLGHYFTRAELIKSTWCLCQGEDDGRPMISCSNDHCNIKWYHFECVGLTDVPEELWVCNPCSI